ncbi:MAG: gliding motility-associated C-terminal domain-containing protein [Flavobacteriales bacterium]
MRRLLANVFFSILLFGSIQAWACDPIIITANIIHENDCGLGPNGAIDISIQGGVGPYTYTWTNGDTTEDISNLTSGSYGITVYDSNNCPGFAGFVVELVDPLSISDLSIYPSCAGDLGTGIVSVSGGNEPYQFSWSNGSVDSFANNLNVGFHQVIVTDASGCIDSLDIEIQTNPELQIFPIVQHSVCYSDSGSVELLILGGAPSYTINWNGIDSLHVPPGTHSVSVTDVSGCEKTVNYTVLSEDEIIVDLLLEIESCDSNYYSATVNVLGGVSPYTYDWSVSDSSEIHHGNHSLVITDSLGCSIEKMFTIDTVHQMLDVDYSYGSFTCEDTIIEVTLNIEGGLSPYQILWSDGTLNLFTKIVTIGQNEYVTVTDERGCETVVNFDISGPGQIHLHPMITPTTCGNNNGTLVFNATGGSGTYTYQFNGLNVSSSLSNIAPGSYDVVVSDNQGCSLDTNIVIPEISVAKILFEEIKHNTCSSDSSGSITLKFDNLDLKYLWSNGDTTVSIKNIPGGEYKLTITDTLGCEWDSTFVVNRGSVITGAITNTFNPCELNGDDGLLTIYPSGGNEPYSFLWEDGSTDSELIIDSIGVYTVTVTDSNGCSGDVKIQVKGDPIGGNLCFNIPNAFSPNEDGFNDTWLIKGIHSFPNAKIQIFDRWGKLVVDQINYNTPWDGKVDGEEVEMGSYFYMIDLNSGGHPVFKGVLSIKR